MTQSQVALTSADLIEDYSKLGGDLTLAHQKLGAIQANLAKVRASESAQHAIVEDLELKYTFARIMTSKNALGKLMGLKSSQLTLMIHISEKYTMDLFNIFYRQNSTVQGFVALSELASTQVNRVYALRSEKIEAAFKVFFDETEINPEDQFALFLRLKNTGVAAVTMIYEQNKPAILTLMTMCVQDIEVLDGNMDDRLSATIKQDLQAYLTQEPDLQMSLFNESRGE